LILDSGIDVEYHQKAAGGTNHGVRARWSINKSGSVSKIDGSLGEKLEIVLQDDISDLVNMQIRAQGHLVETSET
jgi:hypothetical protein